MIEPGLFNYWIAVILMMIGFYTVIARGNQIKKIERIRLGLVGGTEDLDALAEELADVVICADLIAMDLEIDLGEAVAKKFNQTSSKYGLETMFQHE